MKDAFYFPHDYNAQRDPKIMRMLRAHGWEAYGIYWALIERLYEQGGRISEDFEHLAYELRTDAGKVMAVASNFDLFFFEDGMMGSGSVDRRLEERRERQQIARKNGLASAAARNNRSTTVEQPLNDRSTTVQLERKERKERKERTTAPLAVDDLVSGMERAATAREIEVALSEARLPFDFGEKPDYFPKGFRIQDLPAETAKAILTRMPRLSLRLEEILKARIAQKTSAMTPSQREAYK